MKLPSMKYLANELCFKNDYINQRLSMPWTGLTMLEKDNDLQLLALNAVGDLFEAVIHHETVNEDTEIFDATFDMFEESYHNESFSDKEKNFGTDSISNDEFHIEMPVDSFRLNWLRHKHLSSLDKDHLSEWVSSLPRFKKISFVNSVYRRHALPTEYIRRHEHTIKEVTKKVDKKTRKRQKDPKKEVTPMFKNCPNLKVPDFKGTLFFL